MGLFDRLLQGKQAELKILSRKLMVLAISLNDYKEIYEYLSEENFNSIEKQRFLFCLSVLNFSNIIWAINVFAVMRYGQITEKIKNLLNIIRDDISKFYLSIKEGIRIGDYIINNSEMESVDMSLGGGGVSKDTITNYYGVISAIFDSRVKQYINALHSTIKKPPVMLDPVSMLFMNHFAGEGWQERGKGVLVVRLNLLLIGFRPYFIEEVFKMMEGGSW